MTDKAESFYTCHITLTSKYASLKGFSQILYYKRHFGFQKMLPVLVVAYTNEVRHKLLVPYKPSSETSDGGVLGGCGKIHHSQFIFPVYPYLETDIVNHNIKFLLLYSIYSTDRINSVKIRIFYVTTKFPVHFFYAYSINIFY